MRAPVLPARPLVVAVAGVLAVAIAGASAGCDWRKFDDLKKKTPVASIEAPGNYPAGDDFGPILLPLAPPGDGSAAGRFIASATHKTSLAIISFDAAGQASGEGIVNDAFTLLQEWPITAIAQVPGTGKVLLGSPGSDMGGDALVMSLAGPEYMTTTFQHSAEAQYGVGVGAGNVAGGAAPEFVVLSQSVLHLYLDGQATSGQTYPSQATDPCPIDFAPTLPDPVRVNRAVIVGLGPGSTQIAVATPAVTGAGHVSIFNVEPTTGAITCAGALTGAEPHFGQAMTLVNSTGGSAPDFLLVGAPPTHAYLYSLPLAASATPVMMVTDMMADGQFGAAVAAFDIDGKPGDEVLIGNPDGTVGSATTAGRVSIYTGATLALLAATTVPNPLTEHDPGAGHSYGSGIAGMTFCPGNVAKPAGDAGTADAGTATGDAGVAPCTTLPIVGSLSKVYAYFTLKKPDPRAK